MNWMPKWSGDIIKSLLHEQFNTGIVRTQPAKFDMPASYPSSVFPWQVILELNVMG